MGRYAHILDVYRVIDLDDDRLGQYGLVKEWIETDQEPVVTLVMFDHSEQTFGLSSIEKVNAFTAGVPHGTLRTES